MPFKSTLYISAAAAVNAALPAQASFVGAFHENLNSGNNTLFIFGADGTSGTMV